MRPPNRNPKANPPRSARPKSEEPIVKALPAGSRPSPAPCRQQPVTCAVGAGVVSPALHRGPQEMVFVSWGGSVGLAKPTIHPESRRDGTKLNARHIGRASCRSAPGPPRRSEEETSEL